MITYALIFSCIVLLYIWYRYTLWGALKEIQDVKYPKSNSLLSVVVPVYNENPEALRSTLLSLFMAHGNKEVFVVDDGSKNLKELEWVYEHARKLFKFQVIYSEKNGGKREAQYKAFKLLKGKYVVTIDSDTSINSDALIKGAAYLDANPNVGAVTGQVRARNAKKNLLTRMIDARYANAFLFERKSQSAIDIVTCCCGSLSIYRADVVRQIQDRYANQYFLGVKQNFGDDRHMTNLILMLGYKVRFLQNMIAYTDVPEKLPQFLKQQLRWNQSFVRENIVLFPYAIRKSPWLTFELIITTLIPFMALPLRLSVVGFAIIFPIVSLHILTSVLIMGTVRNIWLLAHDEKHIFLPNIAYGVLHFLTVYWLLFIAVYKVFAQRNTSWGTRVIQGTTQ